MSPECPHDLTAHEIAWVADGLCALCLLADVQALRAANEVVLGRCVTQEAEVVALRADAERYQWFKTRCWPAIGMLAREGHPMPTDFDEAIDSARLAEKDKGG